MNKQKQQHLHLAKDANNRSTQRQKADEYRRRGIYKSTEARRQGQGQTVCHTEIQLGTGDWRPTGGAFPF